MLMNIQNDISRADFEKIMKSALELGSIGLLVKRKELNFSNKAKIFISKLSSFLIEVLDANEWPGTQLLDGIATLYYFKINSDSVNLLLNTVQSVKDFVFPDNLEDLCLLKKDKNPWFISITHEKDFYFQLDENELQVLHSMKIEALNNVTSS